MFLISCLPLLFQQYYKWLRKNAHRWSYLSSASPKGTTASCIVYTMVEIAKESDLNTYKYLTYLLLQRPNDKMSDEQFEQFDPWSEAAKANCQN